jgi:hypothetical protein
MRLLEIAASAFVLVTSAQAHAELRWVPKDAPEQPIPGGSEYGHAMDVCRGVVNDGKESHLVIGKTWPGYSKCNVSFFGKELLLDNWEKLVGTEFEWVGAHDEGYPAGAVIAGHAGDGKPFLVCAAPFEGGMHPGYIADSNCFFGWGGKGHDASQYVVLRTTNPSVEHAPGARAAKGGVPEWLVVVLAGGVIAFCVATHGACLTVL